MSSASRFRAGRSSASRFATDGGAASRFVADGASASRFIAGGGAASRFAPGGVMGGGLISSLASLPTTMVINGIAGDLEFFVVGQDATPATWPSRGGGANLSIAGGTAPILGQPSPTVSTDDAVVANVTGGAPYYPSSGVGEILTKDAVIEVVYKIDDASVALKNLAYTLSGTGWAIRIASNDLQFVLTGASGTVLTGTATSWAKDHQWEHLLIFIDYSGRLAIYNNGAHLISSSVDVGATTGSIVNGTYALIGHSFPGAIAQMAMWTREDWLDTHLQWEAARDRFYRLAGVSQSVAGARAASAYSHHPVGSALKYFRVGDNWPRLSQDIGGSPYLQNEAATTTYTGGTSNLSHASFTPTRCSVAATPTECPDLETRTAVVVHEDATAAATHHMRQGIGGLAAGQYTYSFYAKALNRRYIIPWVYGTGVNAKPVFDLQGVAVTLEDAASTDGTSITDIGDGWCLCEMQVTVPSGTSTVTAYHFPEDSPTAAPTTPVDGQDWDSFAICMQQFEAGDTRTSLVNSVGWGPETRPADVVLSPSTKVCLIKNTYSALSITTPARSGVVLWSMRRELSASINSDVTRIYKVYKADVTPAEIVTGDDITYLGEIETAIKQNGKADFVGGITHGDEEASATTYYVDDVETALADMAAIRDCDELRIEQTSQLWEEGTGGATPLATVQKTWTFTASGLELDQTVTWQQAALLDVAYVSGMFPIYREQNGGIVTTGYRSPGYAPEDISAPGHAEVATISDTARTTGTAGVSLEMAVQSGWTLPNRTFLFSASILYAKLYFDMCGVYTTTIAEVWNVVTTFAVDVE